MWKQWATAILGILVILIPYLGFPFSWIKIFFVICGFFIVVLSFWALSEAKNRLVQN